MSTNTSGPANLGLTMLGSCFVEALRSVEAAVAGGRAVDVATSIG